ncbi:hypothetical protein BB558_007215 [Smittium angustum]|uniref:Uncharacterized protein n=1 Tax=Smittium angustum TaxID=133377 RepID=A0A2U1IVN0_SMIAN|nr:hypothetical protein BB558_007215 [Smittium angustum]
MSDTGILALSAIVGPRALVFSNLILTGIEIRLMMERMCLEMESTLKASSGFAIKDMYDNWDLVPVFRQ